MAREKLGALGRAYVALGRRHIEREDITVFPLAFPWLSLGFPLAERALKVEDWVEIDAAISGDHPLFGPEVADHYLALYKSLMTLPVASG